jgi:hypothetical protein
MAGLVVDRTDGDREAPPSGEENHRRRLAMNNRTSERPTATTGEAGVSVRWDDSTMRSAYANVCNVTGTREEIILLFGVNQSWNSAQRELVVQLLDRVIMSPFAAKRLSILLTRVLREYESRYGQLQTEVGDQPRPSEQLPTG